jgi:hypothetical protein
MPNFDLTQEIDTSKNISVNYLPMGITSIIHDAANNWISGLCGRGSSSNITFVSEGVTKEYKADKLWIVSNQDETTPLHNVIGKTYNAELFIRNVNMNNSDPIYMCFLLNVSDVGIQTGQIDGISRAAVSDPPITSLSVDLNADIFRKSAPDAKFVHYKSVNKGSGRDVFIYSEPISVTTVAMLGLQNNLELFDMNVASYNIIQSAAPGDWMECDYVPIDSEEATTYNLPIASGLVQDQSANQSLKTMVMFILFIIFTMIGYTVIPTAYYYTVKNILEYFEIVENKQQIQYETKIASVLTVCISLIAFGSLMVGIGYDSNSMLLFGMCLGIFCMLGIIIIKSKYAAINGWPVAQIQEEMK